MPDPMPPPSSGAPLTRLPPSAEEITLATIRQHAEMTMQVTASAERGTFAAGRRAEARDVLAILDMNGRPADEPVVFRNPLD